MIGYLEGTIHSLQADRVIVMAGGVGYLVQIPLSTYYKLEGQSKASLRIHTHVREDLIALFGFHSAEEKTAFEKLITISGIGPRLAQVILSGIDVHELAEAIVRGDVRRLSAIPGVGKKTAERICLELREKLVLGEADARKPASAAVPADDDAISALINLGYKPAVAEESVRAARTALGEDAELSQLIRTALSKLAK